eukprot:10547060-Prorocentrum_lima.AAC.1
MVGMVKEQLRKVLHAAGLGEDFWPYAAMYITDVRQNTTGRPWVQPARLQAQGQGRRILTQQ